MKYCIFSDIHGNYKQFKKFTQRMDFQKADYRICLGDVVGLGPFQKECMDLLCKYDYQMTLGNHEARMTKYIDDIKLEIDPADYYQFELFRKELNEYLPLFEKLPKSISLNIANKKFLFTHYGWIDNKMSTNDPYLKTRSLCEQFGIKNGEYDYVIYGHLHSPNMTIEGKTKFICVGSLGLKSPSNYLVIEENNGKLNIKFKTMRMNKIELIKDARKLNYPNWEQLLYYNYDNKLEIDFAKKILLTGGGGYLGTNVAQKLLNMGYNVIIADNFSNSHEEITYSLVKKYSEKLNICKIDLLNKKQLNDLFAKENISAVMHFANDRSSLNNKKSYYKKNEEILKYLLVMVNKYKIKNFLFPSTTAIYGNCKKNLIDENEKCKPILDFAKHKLRCENIIKEWQKQTLSNVSILRISNILGANLNHNLGCKPKQMSIKGLSEYVYYISNDNICLNYDTKELNDLLMSNFNDCVYVEDVSNAFLNAMSVITNRVNVYNICSGKHNCSLNIIENIVKSYIKSNTLDFKIKTNNETSLLSNKFATKQLNFIVTKDLMSMIESQIKFEVDSKQYDNM